MSNGYFHVLTKHEYQNDTLSRWYHIAVPIKGSLEIQHFAKK